MGLGESQADAGGDGVWKGAANAPIFKEAAVTSGTTWPPDRRVRNAGRRAFLRRGRSGRGARGGARTRTRTQAGERASSATSLVPGRRTDKAEEVHFK